MTKDEFDDLKCEAELIESQASHMFDGLMIAWKLAAHELEAMCGAPVSGKRSDRLARMHRSKALSTVADRIGHEAEQFGFRTPLTDLMLCADPHEVTPEIEKAARDKIKSLKSYLYPVEMLDADIDFGILKDASRETEIERVVRLLRRNMRIMAQATMVSSTVGKA